MTTRSRCACGGVFRCDKCRAEYQPETVEDRVIEALRGGALLGSALAARLGYSKSGMYKLLRRLQAAGRVAPVAVGRRQGYRAIEAAGQANINAFMFPARARRPLCPECGAELEADNSSERGLLRCPEHGEVWRYTARRREAA